MVSVPNEIAAVFFITAFGKCITVCLCVGRTGGGNDGCRPLSKTSDVLLIPWVRGGNTH